MTADSNFLSTGVLRKDIAQLQFGDHKPDGAGCEALKDVSAAQDGSIMACIGGTGSGGGSGSDPGSGDPNQRHITIGSNRQIVANPNSAQLFSYLGYDSGGESVGAGKCPVECCDQHV
jgi:hypothetical protein